MLDVAAEVKAKLKSDVCLKELSITIGNVVCGNSDIYEDSFSLEETVMDSTVEFVGCISSILRAKISTLKLPKSNYAGAAVTATLEVWLDEETISESIPLFIGFVDSCQKSADGHWQEIVCYDSLAYLTETPVYNIYKAAFNGNTRTVQYFREYVLSALGLSYETQSLCNDAVKFKKRFRNKDMTALALIRHICQINGAFGIINRDGNFEYRQIDDEALPESVPYYRELKYSQSPIEPIHNAVTIRQSSQDAGVTVTWDNYQQYAGTDPGWSDDSQDDYLVDDDDEDIPDGNYVIEGNLIAHKLKKGKKQVMAANIMASVGHDAVFREHRVVCNGLPYLECCDKVLFTKADSTQIEFVITKRTLKGVQNMTDTFECMPTQEYKSELSGGSHTVSATKASYVSNIGTSTMSMTGAAEQNGLPELINKSVTANGTYEAQLDGADGYAQVTVNVPSSEFLMGTPMKGKADCDIPAFTTVHVIDPGDYRWVEISLPSGYSTYYKYGLGCDGEYFYYCQGNDRKNVYRVPMDDTEADPELWETYPGDLTFHWDFATYREPGPSYAYKITNFHTIIDGQLQGWSDKYIGVFAKHNGNNYMNIYTRRELSRVGGYATTSTSGSGLAPISDSSWVRMYSGSHSLVGANGSAIATYNYDSFSFAWSVQVVIGQKLYGHSNNSSDKYWYCVDIGSTNVDSTQLESSVGGALTNEQDCASSFGYALNLGTNGFYYRGQIAELSHSGIVSVCGDYAFCNGSNKLWKREANTPRIIIPSNEIIADGRYLGYVRDNFEKDDIGNAYILFFPS